MGTVNIYLGTIGTGFRDSTGTVMKKVNLEPCSILQVRKEQNNTCGMISNRSSLTLQCVYLVTILSIQ